MQRIQRFISIFHWSDGFRAGSMKMKAKVTLCIKSHNHLIPHYDEGEFWWFCAAEKISISIPFTLCVCLCFVDMNCGWAEWRRDSRYQAITTNINGKGNTLTRTYARDCIERERERERGSKGEKLPKNEYMESLIEDNFFSECLQFQNKKKE